MVLAALLALATFGSGCVTVGEGGVGRGGQDGFVAPGWMRARQDDFLRFATKSFSPTSVTNVIAHAEAARRRHHRFDASAVTPESFAASFAKIDGFQDTADFDLLYLMNL